MIMDENDAKDDAKEKEKVAAAGPEEVESESLPSSSLSRDSSIHQASILIASLRRLLVSDFSSGPSKKQRETQKGAEPILP
ncbi:unnamed protein product [Cochlearia groenlandica]